MANEFDPYREALVIEQTTIWPDNGAKLDATRRAQAEQQLHAAPQQATELEYVRQHTGFRRQITVTAEDLIRLGLA
jgi:hypothetical protein